MGSLLALLAPLLKLLTQVLGVFLLYRKGKVDAKREVQIETLKETNETQSKAIKINNDVRSASDDELIASVYEDDSKTSGK